MLISFAKLSVHIICVGHCNKQEHFNSSFCLLASYVHHDVCTCLEIEINSHVNAVKIEILRYLCDL